MIQDTGGGAWQCVVERSFVTGTWCDVVFFFFFSYFNAHIFYNYTVCVLLYLEHPALSRGGRRRDIGGSGGIRGSVIYVIGCDWSGVKLFVLSC